MSTPIVILDACVLYPAPLRDLLLWMALSELYRPRWTEAIHEEWIRNLLADRSDLSREKLERTRDLMNAAVPDCMIEGYEGLIDGLTLPDPDDRHVLAAAIHGSAEVIVTSNLADFPADILSGHGLRAEHPDDFISGQFDVDSVAAVSAANRHRESLRNPPKTVEEYLATLGRLSLPQTVASLEPYADLL